MGEGKLKRKRTERKRVGGTESGMKEEQVEESERKRVGEREWQSEREE